MFFFPGKIVVVRVCQEELDIQKEQKKLIKEAKKQCKAIVRKQKA